MYHMHTKLLKGGGALGVLAQVGQVALPLEVPAEHVEQGSLSSTACLSVCVCLGACLITQGDFLCTCTATLL